MTADLLREAAALMRERAEAAPDQPRTDADVMGVWLHSRFHLTTTPAVALAVADWLDDEATQWDQCFNVTQRPSAGVDQPPAIHFGDPDAAARTANHHASRALAVACAYLGRT